MSCKPQLASDTVEIFKGESKTLRLSVLDEARDPQDLAGSTLTFTVKKDIDDTATVILKTSATPAEITILSPTTLGQADIFLSPSDTSSVEEGDYVYDIWVELPSGKKVLAIEPSLFKIKLAVTVL